MNPLLSHLSPYPFERLARLKAGVSAPSSLEPIDLGIGEPRHEPPPEVLATLRENLQRLGAYPSTAGLAELRESCARWLERRYRLPGGSIDAASMVLPVSGTREGLFSFVQAAVDGRRSDSAGIEPLVLMPNPCYQIYEGAALLAGARPHFLPTTAANDYTPDLDAVPESIWRRCQVLFLCSPANPTGKVLSLEFLQRAIALAERHEFIIAADECYTEIYLDERSPPPGLLEAAVACGHPRFERCIVFHSLSKRSSVPGLRSGFVCAEPQIISRYLLYRTYHGVGMPVPTQLASITAWQDDGYAARNRRLYQEKFERVLPILAPHLKVAKPDGAFYLWPDVARDDERFARELYASQAVTVLPGSYLGRAGPTGNPGAGRVRISLVHSVERCVQAAERIRDFVRRNPP
ncbi:MAG TPA: succinyldiaminopimelate transaminase [Steroidobacteraceae bacterium]|nr:succinyldiaminopimelate transaminase [Steroidobacteraceae bacterium]